MRTAVLLLLVAAGCKRHCEAPPRLDSPVTNRIAECTDAVADLEVVFETAPAKADAEHGSVRYHWSSENLKNRVTRTDGPRAWFDFVEPGRICVTAENDCGSTSRCTDIHRVFHVPQISDLAPFPGPARTSPVHFNLDRAYVGLGIARADGLGLSDLYAFDPAGNNWVAGPPLPVVPEGVVTGFAVEDRGVVLLADNSVWLFDPKTGWSQGDDFPGPARVEAAGITIEGVGYLLGGREPDGNGGGPPGTAFSDLWAYDGTGAWQQLGDIPLHTGHFGGLIWEEQRKLRIESGWTVYDPGGPPLREYIPAEVAYEYVPWQDAWTEVDPLGEPGTVAIVKNEEVTSVLADFEGSPQWTERLAGDGEVVYVAQSCAADLGEPPAPFEPEDRGAIWAEAGLAWVLGPAQAGESHTLKTCCGHPRE